MHACVPLTALLLLLPLAELGSAQLSAGPLTSLAEMSSLWQ